MPVQPVLGDPFSAGTAGGIVTAQSASEVIAMQVNDRSRVPRAPGRTMMVLRTSHG